MNIEHPKAPLKQRFCYSMDSLKDLKWFEYDIFMAKKIQFILT
jgi:hypothetical protein